MGRRAKPIDLLVLDGKKNLTKKEIEARKTAEKKIKPQATKVRPPTWLSKEAKKEFRRLANELLTVDLITNVDVDALALYCDAYVDYVRCTRIIDEEGLLVEYTNKAAETNKVPHPLLTKKKQLYDQMKTLASEFGLTPSARAKIAIPKQEKKEPTEFEKTFGDL